MNYYKIGYESNTDIVGEFPQCESVCELGDIQKDFLPFEGRINEKFVLPEPDFQKKAKQTSLIWVEPIPSWFLVVDHDFLSFVKKYNIGNHQSWNLKVWQNKKVFNNYNLFIINDTKQRQYLDFSESKFYEGTYKDFTYKGGDVAVENYDDYLQKRKDFKNKKIWLRESKVTFNLHDVKDDIFRIINVPFGGYYVSENLKNDLIENNFTGISFTDISKIHPNLLVNY